MKKNSFIAVGAILMSVCFSFCNSNSSNNGSDRDTAMKVGGDTAVISGTPGSSGSQPRPDDTSRSNSDSLKHTHTLIDSAK
jgi:hypothetical protein